MRLISHLRLSLHILSKHPMGMPESIAYLFGNIEPDLCFFSYFRNTEPGDRGRGHNYKTAMARIRKLELSLVPDGIAAAYTLGKITHYAADIFTFPHNPHLFIGSLKDHMAYERVLDDMLSSYLEVCRESFIPDSMEGACDYLAELHGKYEKEAASPSNDLFHILRAATALRTAFSYVSGGIARRAVGRF